MLLPHITVPLSTTEIERGSLQGVLHNRLFCAKK